MNKWLKYGLVYVGITYVYDVIVIPNSAAKQARAYADSLGKPLLNVGAGTPHSSLRVSLLGPTLWGDANIDIAADKSIPHGPDVVSYADAHVLPWSDKHFGAVIASHVLEHMDDPLAALKEWDRVADAVYATVPKWWAPHTWTHMGHRWFIDGNTGRAYPLWKSDKSGSEQVELTPDQASTSQGQE
jgi:SAM-dependent methyltransferase